MKEKYAVVVGAVNVDIWGKSFAPLIDRDSNPGEIRYSLGGVGRNIAHNMSLLGVNTKMLTALGGDMWARSIEENCREIGIGLEHALHLPDARSSSYLCISGPDGDLAIGLCDADIADHITAGVIERELDFLNGAELVVFDGNLTYDTIDCLTKKCTAPLFADPVSVTKAHKLLPFLDRIHTIKPNHLEAQVFTGVLDAGESARILVEKGVRRAFVSDGSRGMAVAEAGRELKVPCCTARLVNATGGGDAVMAAICKSYLSGWDVEQTARYAMAAGAMAVECAETINKALCHEAVCRRLDG